MWQRYGKRLSAARLGEARRVGRDTNADMPQPRASTIEIAMISGMRRGRLCCHRYRRPGVRGRVTRSALGAHRQVNASGKPQNGLPVALIALGVFLLVERLLAGQDPGLEDYDTRLSVTAARADAT